MKHLGLFEGIGGFSLASRWMGWETVAWCEWNEFGQKVLGYHFPEAEGFGDITKTDFTKYANKIDVITGGFPCQPYSLAGKRKGKEDSRHLWPEMLRAIREVKPKWVIGENVYGLVNWDGGLVHHEVQSDLEAEGYEVFSVVLPACSVGAPHRRDRIWFVAHSNNQGNTTSRSGGNGNIEKKSKEWEHSQPKPVRFCDPWNAAHSNRNGLNRSNSEHEKQPSERGVNALNDVEQVREYGDATNTNCKRSEKCNISGKSEKQEFSNRKLDEYRNVWHNFPTQPPILRGNDGLSRELDGITFSKWRNESIKAYGNAIVPQVAFELFKVIQHIEDGC